MSIYRSQVLSLYKAILRAGKQWTVKPGSQAARRKESEHIITEAKTLFRQNQKLENGGHIKDAIKEGESRLEIAQHYDNPWPRPVHIPLNMLPPTDRRSKKSDRLLRQSKPAYLRSYNIGDKDTTD